MKRLIFLLAGLVLAAGPAAAQPASDAPPAPPRPAVITNVAWETRPTLRADDYPAIPLVFEMEGTAALRCIARSDGSVANCEATTDDWGLGFNDAAIRVVERGRLDPMTVDGVAQNATFTVRIPFRLGLEDGPPTYAGEEPSPELLALVRADVDEAIIPGVVIDNMIGWLSPEERARVEIHFVRAFRDKGELWAAGLALGMARLAPPEVVAALQTGQTPPRVGLRQDISAMDQMLAAEREIRARAREYFCAQHSCPDED